MASTDDTAEAKLLARPELVARIQEQLDSGVRVPRSKV